MTIEISAHTLLLSWSGVPHSAAIATGDWHLGNFSTMGTSQVSPKQLVSARVEPPVQRLSRKTCYHDTISSIHFPDRHARRLIPLYCRELGTQKHGGEIDRLTDKTWLALQQYKVHSRELFPNPRHLLLEHICFQRTAQSLGHSVVVN